MKKIVAATPEDTGRGFGLAGIRHLVPHAGEMRDVMALIAADQSIGLFIVDERLIDGALQRRLDDVDRQWPGLVVILPAPAVAEHPEEDYALRLIRRAIGYQVRLNV